MGRRSYYQIREAINKQTNKQVSNKQTQTNQQTNKQTGTHDQVSNKQTNKQTGSHKPVLAKRQSSTVFGLLLTLPEAGFYEYFASGCVVPIGTIPAIKFRTNKQTNKTLPSKLPINCLTREGETLPSKLPGGVSTTTAWRVCT